MNMTEDSLYQKLFSWKANMKENRAGQRLSLRSRELLNKPYFLYYKEPASKTPEDMEKWMKDAKVRFEAA